MYEAEWHKVYDVIEAIYEALASGRDRVPQSFADEVNAYFEEEGVGWKLEDVLSVRAGQKPLKAWSLRQKRRCGMLTSRRLNHIFMKPLATSPAVLHLICQAQFTTPWVLWNASPVTS